MNCVAPMCAGYDTEDIVWYPGERVCQKKPFTKWQKRQAMINRWVEKGQFKNAETYFTKDMLEKPTYFRRSTKGVVPDSPSDYALWR